MKRRFQPGVLAVFAAVACAEAPAESGWVAEETRAGDTVTVMTLSGQLWPDVMVPVIDLSIGVLDGDAQYMFGEITRLAEDGAGGIYVFDRQGPILRHYDAEGRHVRDVGRGGEGPGEYDRLILGMAVDPDGVLYVSDWGNGRVTRFGPDGEALDPWRIDAPFLTTTPGRWVFTDGPGRFLMRMNDGGRPGLLVVDGGEVADTIWVPDLPGLPELRGGPYRIDRYWSWHPEGHLVDGVSDAYTLEHRRADGVLRFGRVVEPIPVHAEEAAQVRRRFERMEALPAYSPPEGEWVPEYMPPFSGVQVADDGNVWVRRHVAPVPVEGVDMTVDPPPVAFRQPHVYDVFDGEGRYLGEVAFGEDVDPLLFGDGTIWGVRRGDFDEEYVVRMRLVVGG